MKKTAFIALLSVLSSPLSLLAENSSTGSLTINLPSEYTVDKVIVSRVSLDDMLANRQQAAAIDTLSVENGVSATLLDITTPAYYNVILSPESNVNVYAAPGENLTVTVNSLTPYDYTVSGTPLMEGITEYNAITLPIEEKFRLLTSGGEPSRTEIDALVAEYDSVTNDFVNRHIDSPAVVYALMNTRGLEFVDLYNKIGPSARTSILMPFAEAKLPAEQRQAEAERFQQSLLSGSVEAPAFTFPDLNGNPVSLSDFKGQWVVIDFWGSWCGWCIKGFPKLKEAYAKADGKFQVIGIDCRDSESNWRMAVEKYKLPWVNVYNGDENSPVLRAYGVTGFPTKAIVNPEGKLVDITVGEDPAFYEKLNSFIK